MTKKTEIRKGEAWTRSPGFTKHYATVFGINRTKDLVRIDFGNENIGLPDGKTVHVSDVQILIDIEQLRILRDLLTHTLRKRKRK